MSRKLSEEELQCRRLLGARLKAARLMVGCSSMGVFAAKYFNKGMENMIAQWEAGRRLPSDEALKDIAHHCNVNFEWLKTGEGDMLEDVHVPPDEALRKKAIAGFELLARHYADRRDNHMPLSPMEKSLAAYMEGRGLKLPLAQGDGEIDEKLLAAIIEAIIQAFKSRFLEVKPDMLAKGSSKLYSNIIQSTDDMALRINMVKPLVGACDWLFLL